MRLENSDLEEMSKTREAIKNNLLPYMESEGYVLSLDSRYMHNFKGYINYEYIYAIA